MTVTTADIDLGCPSGLAPASEDKPGALEAFVKTQDGTSTLHLLVRGAKCGGCLSKIEKAANALPGVESARLNLSTGKMRIDWAGPLSADDIGATISRLGYGVSAFSEDAASTQERKRERDLLISMGVAGFGMANIMLLSVSVWGGHGEMGDATRQVLHGISGLIALPVVAWSGRHFFGSAWSVLRHGRANMDVPISLALILAFSVSVWETLHHGPHAYFDACVMLLFFLLIGRFLDARLQRQAHAAAHELAALQSASVNLIDPSGSVSAVPAAEVAHGDLVLLSTGERAVIDLRILSGTSEVDESLVTGESLPRQTGPGDTLFAGAVNLGQPLQGSALGAADTSLLSEIGRMLEAGEQRRSAYRKIADRAVGLYVPFVHTAAALAALSWWLVGAGPAQAIMIAVTTLIITCPCALALAAPVAQVVAAGRLFKQGVYLRSGDALERLAEVDHVVFDKTGTLSIGAPQLVALLSLNGDLIASDLDSVTPDSDTRLAPLFLAAKLARASRHPLSRAIVATAGPGPFADGISETPGCGLEADIDGAKCRLGSAEWVGVEPSQTTLGPQLWFVCGDNDPVCFRFADRVQDDAVDAIEGLKRRGLSIEILSGDQPGAVSDMSTRLGIARWQAGATPQDKVARLEALRADGRKVLMVGDGLNDAGALALAHAALAPGGAMDVSQSASDAVYSSGLKSVEFIVDIAQSARGVMRQNFGLAALYNVFVVPIAVAGLVTPLIAAIAMSASSLIVTLNALRIRSTG